MEKAESVDVIGSLYTLRAGLSLVAQEKEAFEREVDAARINRDLKIKEIDSKIETANAGAVRHEEQLKKLKKEYDKCTRNAAKDALKDYHGSWGRILLIIILSAIWVAAICVCGTLMSKQFIALVFFVILLGNGFIGSIIGIIFLVKLIRKIKWYCTTPTEHKEAIKRLPELKEEIASLEKIAEKERAELTNKLATLNSLKDEPNEVYLNECEKAKKHVAAAGEIIKALQDNYSYLLDMRDWANLDLIIYSLETQRADTVKEALRIVDGERRANRIAEAVNQASAEICRYVNDGLSSLRYEMGAKICALSKQITKGTAKMSEIAGETSMNRALIEQATKSSAQLAEVAEQIRNSTKYIADHI